MTVSEKPAPTVDEATEILLAAAWSAALALDDSADLIAASIVVASCEPLVYVPAATVTVRAVPPVTVMLNVSVAPTTTELSTSKPVLAAAVTP